MPPQSSAFRQSLAPTSAYARHLSYSAAQNHIYNNPAPAPPTQRTERDILLSHHRFLQEHSSATTTTAEYERALVASYDAKLYKEFVLIELSQYRAGRVAMRWRTEEEVKKGKGERTCAALDCEEVSEGEREVLFSYVEDGEAREAMVKVRLCEPCGVKLTKAREREGGGKKKEEGRSRSERKRRDDRRRSGSRSRRRRDGSDGRRTPTSTEKETADVEHERERRPYRRRDESKVNTQHRSPRRRGRSRSPSPIGDSGERGPRRKQSKSLYRHRPESEGD